MKKTNTRSATTVKQIGVVGVDSGCLMVGDPCYYFGPGKTTAQEAFPREWPQVCDEGLHALDNNSGAQLQYAPGHPGLGVVVNTTYGDGVYPVYLETDAKGRRRLIVDLD